MHPQMFGKWKLLKVRDKEEKLRLENWQKKEKYSPAGNRTPVSRVTGGDTHHYTTEEVVILCGGFDKL